jgi:hypothetical protein
MGSFKTSVKEQKPKRLRRARRQGFPRLELLEERRLLSNGPTWHPTTTNLADVQNGPMANLGGQLISLYETFRGGETDPRALAHSFPLMQFQGDSVDVGLTAWTDFATFKSNLANMGMELIDYKPRYDGVDGWLPINELPTAAELPQILSGQPNLKPVTYGAAINEADYSTFANVASTQFNLNGSGVTVGVISNSFNNLGGYATDISTGDLPTGVNILQDLPSGGDDEGRAMAQNIYHIAPGAGLAYATGALSDASFGQNIVNLANTAGAKVIVDDLGTSSDPFFQPGYITQGINQVVSQGVTYLSAAGNEADHGYLSNFRGVNGTVTGLGAGRFMNFDGSGGTNLLLPITTNVNNVSINFQFDQPWATQEPTGGPGPTSQVFFFVLDSAGNVVASGANNNVAMQIPQQFVTIPTAGSYFVAIQMITGPDPGHVEFVQFGQQSTNDLIISKQFGSAGGTFYPSSFGHNASFNTIGVGAVPWWAPAPFLGQSPLGSEPFSSTGPSIQVFDATGQALSAPRTTLNPTVTAPDGGNTTFFGFVADTSNPPIPGQPATSTNLYATFTPNQANLPSFFGTSSAAPNTAAIVALMLQKSPGASVAQIKSALIASAASNPMNGSAPGTWDSQGGFGLVNAINAINAVDLLRVASTNPANGQVVTSTPSAITVTFNKPVVFSTVSTSDLVFLSTPPGVTVNLGAPIAVDNPVFPTVVAFPFSFSYSNPPTTTANGPYSFKVDGPIMSRDGKTLIPSGTITFTLEDITRPAVANTSVFSRVVTIQFTKAMNPATITLANVFVQRQGGTGNWNNPIDLNNDPRTHLTYNPLTNTATLDYSGLPQTEMPTDDYRIVVKSGLTGVTDLVGNELDGAFSGFFPSGNGTPDDDFIQDLGLQVLQAPVVTTFQMTSATDTGIPGDQNTNVTQPQFIGQVFNSFPGTVANLQVYVEFNGAHPALGGGFDLAVGPGNPPRGLAPGSNYDVLVTTDASGKFQVTAPPLPEGFQRAQIVVVGQPDSPPLPGFSSQQQHAFRIDKTPPQITSASLTQGGAHLPLPGFTGSPTPISQLTTLSLNVIDYSNPSSTYLATPFQVLFPALDPATASNISNYSLILNPGTPNQVDESQFISTATFTASAPTPDNPVNPSTIMAYNGVINLTFKPGLPAGIYSFIAHTTEGNFPGLTDAAGNPLDETYAQPGGMPIESQKSFIVKFNVQPTPVFITNLQMQSTWNPTGPEGATTIGGPRSYYEQPSTDPTYIPRAPAPPTAWVVDLSNPIPFTDYSTQSASQLPLQLIGSADSANAPADGNFGTLGEAGLGSTGTGFTIVSNVSLALYNFDPTSGMSTLVGPGGTGNRLVLTYTGGTLPADYYRLYMPNEIEPAGIDTRLFDIFGNQLDGEFLANPTAAGGFQDLLPNGQYRNGLSGNLVPGGAFMTGFVVVPHANIIYARPDYVEDPLLPATAPDGSLAKPYSTLAPEGDPATAPPNPNHDPNGGLNSSQFFLSGFNPIYDRNGNGRFDRSALYAASQLAFNGPVVVVALPGTPQRDPITGNVTQQTFVLQAPSGPDNVINNGSASVPFDTTLVFNPGSAVKLQNASLYVENQGSAIEVQGGATSSTQVNFTSYGDDSVGGNTNGGRDTTPHPGDWGGIVLRNFDNFSAGRDLQFPGGAVNGVGDGPLVGPNDDHAMSGADDIMSIINFAKIAYAGSAVPQTQAIHYDAVTLYNSRPAITNSIISQAGTGSITQGTTSAAAAISADLDSFRQDDTASGPLIRKDTLTQNSLNGIWVRPDTFGFVEQSDAELYPDNPSTLGGSRNFTFFADVPYLFTSQMVIGQERLVNTDGQIDYVTNRVYIQPGTLMKFQRAAGIALLTPGASLNVGSRSYITGFDQDNSFNPNSAGFTRETTADARVVFTSLYDAAASTSFIDPITSQATTIVAPINSANVPVTGGVAQYQPTPGNVPEQARWGSVSIQSGGLAIINDAEFRYGGGPVNTTELTIPQQSVLAFITNFTFWPLPLNATPDLGTHAYITNNNFFDNLDAAMQIEPNGLLAADPLRPLQSGHPFFRGNVMQRNDIDGMAVTTARSYFLTPNYSQPVRPFEAIPPAGFFNESVSGTWDSTDLTYVLRGTITPGGFTPPTPSLNTYISEPTPGIVITLQSALPGTLLANGETIARPGEPLVVKLMSDETPNGAGTLSQFGSQGVGASVNVGAGFAIGVEDGVDPPASPFVDPGVNSELRILGIAGNETTGQQRVPVIMTSLRDNTVGTTVRGVTMDKIYNNDPLFPARDLNTPAKGDGGYIYYGGLGAKSYDLTDPRAGSVINNADIRDLTRIEVQGGGVIDIADWVNPPQGIGLDDAWWAAKMGYPQSIYGAPGIVDPQLAQFNAPTGISIIDSNLNGFADAAVYGHPSSLNPLFRDWTPNLADPTLPPPGISPNRAALRGEPVNIYMVNDTITNSNEGVHVESETQSDNSGESPQQVVLLHNTFYNDNIALHTVAPAFNGTNRLSHVYWLAMDNIFSNSSNTPILALGQQAFSQAQYNLYAANTNDINVPNPNGDFAGNLGAVYVSDAGFRDPTNLNFQLLPSSPAIDAARSELGPAPAGNAVYPSINQVLNSSGGTRTDPASLPPNEVPGGSNPFGGIVVITDPRQLVELMGTPNRGFIDNWVPALQSDPSAILGPSTIPGTFAFTPIRSERDQLGYQRVDDPSVPNTGFGSRPWFDIGAYEFRQFFPPHVTAVTATITNPASPTGTTTVPFYKVGGIAGSNTTPISINVTFDKLLDPNTITSQTVLLEVSDSNGQFGPNSTFVNLAGKLSFNNPTETMVINLGGSGLTLVTSKYRLILLGTGANVIRDNQGEALDGENTDPKSQDLPDNPQLPLPSGDGFPGGNFYDTFLINTTPPSIKAGTFMLAPQSDTNIVGDFVTMSALPSFVGTISEPNPNLVPVGGQTAIVDIGIAQVGTSGTTVYFADSPNIPPSLLPYLRENAGTATTDVNGNFTVTVGVDAANTGLVTDTAALLDSPYNVGSSGKLVPLPGTVSGYYVARARAIDQSGNQSNPADTNAQAPFVVDTTSPTVTVVNPANNSVIETSTGPFPFLVDTSQNMDLTHFTPSQIKLVKSAPNGSFTGPGTSIIAISPTITVDYLDKTTGGAGREAIHFTSAGALANGLYQLTLLGSGSNGIRDIAGNLPAGGDVVVTFAVFNPSNVHGVFVGGPSFVTDPTQPQGDRANPFPTIAAALAAAAVGDRLELLPGLYTENVTLQPFVSIASADVTSTDTSFVPGNALDTVIRAPATTGNTPNVTVSATNLKAFVDPSTGFVFETELAGLTISSPLVGDPALGTINPSAIGLQVTNSNMLADKDYFIDAGTGIWVTTSDATSLAPQIVNDGPIGNITGIVVQDAGSSNPATRTSVINNTIAFNTNGMVALNSASTSSEQAYVANNIFWQNHDQSIQRHGIGIVSQTINKLVLNNNMFSGNGASDTNPSGAAVNIGNGFDPTKLGPLASDAQANLGNFTGYPAFIAPRDPRPFSDGPATFMLDANYGLTATSAAINNALESVATKTDFLGNPENPNPTSKGFHLPGYGPRDVGAFEFEPTGTPGTTPVGGTFRVVTTSLVPGGATKANGASLNLFPAPTSVIVDFSRPVNEATVHATDLILTGSDINLLSPVRATSVTWLDNHTARFNLTGQFNTAGTVNVSLPGGSIMSTTGAPLAGYSDQVVLTSTPPSPAPPPTPAPAPPPTPPPTPAPAPPPRVPPGRHRHVPPKHHRVTPPPHHRVVVHNAALVPAPSRKPPKFPGKTSKKH